MPSAMLAAVVAAISPFGVVVVLLGAVVDVVVDAAADLAEAFADVVDATVGVGAFLGVVAAAVVVVHCEGGVQVMTSTTNTLQRRHNLDVRILLSPVKPTTKYFLVLVHSFSITLAAGVQVMTSTRTTVQICY